MLKIEAHSSRLNTIGNRLSKILEASRPKIKKAPLRYLLIIADDKADRFLAAHGQARDLMDLVGKAGQAIIRNIYKLQPREAAVDLEDPTAKRKPRRKKRPGKNRLGALPKQKNRKR